MTRKTLATGDIVAFGFLAAVVGAFVYVALADAQPVLRHVPADQYLWPAGCKPTWASDATPEHTHYFSVDDVVPNACLVPQYYIQDAGRYHLSTTKAGRRYYRIGSDAINIDCFDEARCIADRVERDVFQEPDTSFH